MQLFRFVAVALSIACLSMFSLASATYSAERFDLSVLSDPAPDIAHVIAQIEQVAVLPFAEPAAREKRRPGSCCRADALPAAIERAALAEAVSDHRRLRLDLG